nr:lactate utilization protein [uncultured Carboxylicivirga sp.]
MSNNQQNQSNNDREKILNRLKAAQNTTDGSFSPRDRSVRVFPYPDDLLVTFRDELEKIKGLSYVFKGEKEFSVLIKNILDEKDCKYLFTRDPELKEQLKEVVRVSSEDDDFVEMEVGITKCEYLVARTGSVVISSAHSSGRLMNIFPPIHLVAAKASQLVPFLEEAIDGMKDRYAGNMPSQMTVITGASRTADIEKTLVMGAHGPKELIVLIDLEA